MMEGFRVNRSKDRVREAAIIQEMPVLREITAGAVGRERRTVFEVNQATTRTSMCTFAAVAVQSQRMIRYVVCNFA